MLTISIKLYSPGKEKREIIDEALLNYSCAYQYLLDKAYDEIQYIEENCKDSRGGYRASSVAKWFGKDIYRELNNFNIEPFKDSLKIDFSTTLAGYLNLKKVRPYTKYPVSYISGDELEKKHKKLILCLINEIISPSKCEDEIEKYIKKKNVLKPIYFCRYDTKRNYCLLYDDKKDRYFAKIYLMNTRNSKRKILTPSGNRELRYIYKDNEVFKNSGRKECFILFPLSFGKWQETYLKEAVKKPEIIKTARLIKKKDAYYLSINMDIGEGEKIQTNTYMGISRSITTTVHYSVVNDMGSIINSGIGRMPNFMERIPDNHMHEVANLLVKTAKENKSQVIMEKLLERGDRLQWKEKGSEYTPVLNCHNYNHLYKILEYKLPAAGLPPPLRVSPAGIFYTCPDCGTNTKDNRLSSKMFICTCCGLTMNVEHLGSFNLAKKLITYKYDAIKIKFQNTPDGMKFTNKYLGLEFYTSNPLDCMNELRNEIERLVNEFYENIKVYENSKDFNKKFSMVKKIQQYGHMTSLIKIVE